MSQSLASNDSNLTIDERLLAIVRQVLGPSFTGRPLPIDARLADLGITSIKMVNLMLSIEEAFDVIIPQEQINPENFESLVSIRQLLSRVLASDSTAD